LFYYVNFRLSLFLCFISLSFASLCLVLFLCLVLVSISLSSLLDTTTDRFPPVREGTPSVLFCGLYRVFFALFTALFFAPFDFYLKFFLPLSHTFTIKQSSHEQKNALFSRPPHYMGGVNLASATDSWTANETDGWFSAPVLASADNKKDAAFFFPGIQGTTKPTFALELQIVNTATSSSPGTVKVIGGLVPSNQDPNGALANPIDANIPEFVWVKSGNSYLIYKVVEIAKGTFDRLRWCDPKNAKAGVATTESNSYGTALTGITYGEIVLPAAVPIINALPTLAVKGNKSSIKIKILGSWQKIHYDATGYQVDSVQNYAEGSLYFGYADYVEGAYNVAHV
jgi:hypothetical protein